MSNYTDPDEVKIYCSECNGYLYSQSTSETRPKDDLIRCPMVKDPTGRCTGVPKPSKPSGIAPGNPFYLE